MTSKFRSSRRKAPTARKSVFKRGPTTSRRMGMVKRSSNSGYRALRAVRSIQRKLDLAPRHFIQNTSNYTERRSGVIYYPLRTITANQGWICPLTWFYNQAGDDIIKMNTYHHNATTNLLQKLAYLDFSLMFKNTTAADVIRLVIVYDKNSIRDTPLWNEPTTDSTTLDDDKRGLFFDDKIDSTRMPGSHSRYRILYDKTKYLNVTTKPYCKFRFRTTKGFKCVRSLERFGYLPTDTSVEPTITYAQDQVTWDSTNQVPNGCPLTRGALYALVYTDSTTYTEDTNANALENTKFSFNLRLGFYDM